MEISWSAQPTDVRLFILLLLGITCVVLVKTIKLASHLHPLRKQRTISFSALHERSVTAEALVASVMANRVRGVNRPHLEIGATTDQEKDAARLREAAKMRFEYLWSTLYTSVESIKRLSVLTLLTTLFLISYGAVPTFEANFSNKQATGSFALYQTVAALLNRFAFGIMLTAIFYLLYSLFMTALMKRRATWNSLSG